MLELTLIDVAFLLWLTISLLYTIALIALTILKRDNPSSTSLTVFSKRTDSSATPTVHLWPLIAYGVCPNTSTPTDITKVEYHPIAACMEIALHNPRTDAAELCAKALKKAIKNSKFDRYPSYTRGNKSAKMTAAHLSHFCEKRGWPLPIDLERTLEETKLNQKEQSLFVVYKSQEEHVCCLFFDVRITADEILYGNLEYVVGERMAT